MLNKIIGFLIFMCLFIAHGFAENVDIHSKDFKLEGVVISKSKRIAMIGGQFFAVGEPTPLGRLVAVFKDRIVVENNGDMRVVMKTQEA